MQGWLKIQSNLNTLALWYFMSLNFCNTSDTKFAALYFFLMNFPWYEFVECRKMYCIIVTLKRHITILYLSLVKQNSNSTFLWVTSQMNLVHLYLQWCAQSLCDGIRKREGRTLTLLQKLQYLSLGIWDCKSLFKQIFSCCPVLLSDEGRN